MKTKRFLFRVFAFSLSLILCCPAGAAAVLQDKLAISYLEYSDEALTEFSPSMLGRISSGDDYASNCGYDETGLFVSPYYTAYANGVDIPVYASLTYYYTENTGVLQSYSYIYTESCADVRIDFSIMAHGFGITDAVILPQSAGLKAQVNSGKVSVTITDYGIYTFLVNGDSMKYAYTLFVRPDTDEDAEIEQYRRDYGSENVTVFEKGVYSFDCLPALTDNSVLYFKRGSFVSANHIYDLNSEEEYSALPSRQSFISAYNCSNAVIDGCGTLDFTKLDRKERDAIGFSLTENSRISGLILLNSCSWTVITYGSSKLKIDDITVIGYRTNSDGINVCGCDEVRVSDCFCRNGDDCFSVKTTNDQFTCSNVLFERCVGWSTKARCFGITGEAVSDISDITFKDCSVVYRDAVWDNDRVSSLAVEIEIGNAVIDNVAFDNIEIYRDKGRAINCIIYGESITDCTVNGVVFKNISYNADMKSSLTTALDAPGSDGILGFLCRLLDIINPKAGAAMRSFIQQLFSGTSSRNSMEVFFENVTANGTAVTACNMHRYFDVGGNCSATARR